MEWRLLICVGFFFLGACASDHGAIENARMNAEPTGLLTSDGLGARESNKAKINFKLPSSRSTAELEVVDQKRRLFFVFQGTDLKGGTYEVWALDRCKQGLHSVLKALSSESLLMKFQTLHGFVVTESSSENFDLSADSERSLLRKKIALFRQQRDGARRLDCGVLHARN